MSNAEALYPLLPWRLQNLVCSTKGFLLNKQRYSHSFHELFKQYQKRSFLSNGEMGLYRNARLRSFLQYCTETIPFYKSAFTRLGISPEEIRSLSDLDILPIINKSDVQTKREQFNAGSSGPTIAAHTSGTTGAGLQFKKTISADHEQWAVWWRYRAWHGIDFNTWCGYFGGRPVVPLQVKRPPFWRYNMAAKQLLFSGYHLNAENARFYVNQLNRKKPPWIHGYPSLISLLSKFIIDLPLALDYEPKVITLGAENVSEGQKSIIAKAFGTVPRQHYGMAEGVANASECPDGKLHIDEDFSAVELVKDKSTGLFQITGTGFTNKAFPLVRYISGDLAHYDPAETCDCGRPGRIIRSVDGRMEDYIILANGARIGRTDHIFKDMVNIREAQIYQHLPGKITVRISKNSAYNEGDQKRLLEEIEKFLGTDMQTSIEYREHIPRTANGKLRLVVSDIGKV